MLQIPADALESLDPLNTEGAGYEDNDETDERDSDPKPDDESDEAEFKIQIVPRQRKERKIAVSAIQREYLDISFNNIDKMREPAAESGLTACFINILQLCAACSHLYCVSHYAFVG